MKIEFDEGEGRLLDIMAMGALRMILHNSKQLYQGREGYDEWDAFLTKIEGKLNTPERSFHHKFKWQLRQQIR